MKYYTTIEQSKKLVEIGINVNTADMYYPYYLEFDKYPSTPLALDDELKNYQLIGKDIPCWSTEALIKLLPRTINNSKYEIQPIYLYQDGDYEMSYTCKNSYCDELTICKQTLLECAYEIIVKLKEKGIL